MRALIAAVGLLLVFTGWAEARCAGKDLFAELTRTEPAVAKKLVADAGLVANGSGRFWRIEKTGVPASYLFGTFHVSDAVDGVPDAAWAALDQARIAIFEVTLEDEQALQQRMASDPNFMLDPNAPPFADRMSAADLAQVAKAFEARGIDMSVAERLRPWMQISLVTFPPCQLREVERGKEMLDVILAKRAVAAGIPEMGLENSVEALESLSRMTREDQTRLIIAAGRSAPFEEDLFSTNLALYTAGRIALIERFNDWIAERHMPDLNLREVNKRLLESLLDGRNAQWMPRLLPEIEKGNAFVAVGALHLVGEAGLVAALKRAGFTATRLD